jgi:hypothetical protein
MGRKTWTGGRKGRPPTGFTVFYCCVGWVCWARDAVGRRSPLPGWSAGLPGASLLQVDGCLAIVLVERARSRFGAASTIAPAFTVTIRSSIHFTFKMDFLRHQRPCQ